MKHEEQVAAFCGELDALVKRYELEFDLTYGDVVAALEMKKHDLCAQLRTAYAAAESGPPICQACSGTGKRDGATAVDWERCPFCMGTGREP